MLDRKTEDWDASVELLKDKQKQCKHYFCMFYLIGAVMALSGFIIPHPFSIASIGCGLTLLFVAVLIFMAYLQYEFYLFLIHKNVVKAVNKRGK